MEAFAVVENMLNTGPRSYYDDYLRKKSTTRVVEDPTALLTDRNAYVNFLEVQLERVSAACLAVQSSEQRFNDLTGMIQTLEQRCTANIKLIGLAQQCTEQVRAEGDRKYELLMKQQEDDRHSFERHLRQLTVQLTQQERKLEQYEPLQKRVTECERDIASLQDELHALKEHLLQVEEDKNALVAQLEEEREDRQKMEDQLSNTMSANHQKLLAMVDEHHHELSKMYQESVDRFQDLFNAQQESLIEAQQSHRRNVDVAIQKQSDSIEHIQADFIDRLNTHYGDLSQEMALMKESIQQEIDSSIVRSVQTSEELKAAVKLAISEQVQEIRLNIVSEVEDRVAAESQRVLDEYIFLAQSFGDGDASIMYPDAPAPSVDDADSASQRRSSIRSVASLNELKRVPSMMSERSVDSQKSSRKGKSPTKANGVGRQELDAIHNTLQALLEMHRQDVLSIHHRLDAMQIPLGVAPAKPLSRRNSVVKQMDAELKHIPSSHTIDTSISALSMKSFLSDQSEAVKSRTSTVKSKSSLAKKVKAKKAAATAAEDEDAAATESASRGTAMKKRLSFAQAASEKDGSIKEESSLKRKSSRTKSSSDDLNLSGDSSDSDSSSDYEDVARPYELSGNMSFISNKSKDTSRVSKVPTRKIKAPIVKRYVVQFHHIRSCHRWGFQRRLCFL